MEYIGRAFANLTSGCTETNCNRVYLAGHLASQLSDMTEQEVGAIESALNFNFITARIAPVGTSMRPQEIAELRRSAQLIKRTFAKLLDTPDEKLTQAGQPLSLAFKRLLQQKAADAESWDESVLSPFVRAFSNAATAKPSGPNMYLGPSFWAFSEPADRLQARQSWTEANSLLAAGARVLALPTNPRANALYDKWFSLPDRSAVLKTVASISEGMAVRRIGLAYAGPRIGQSSLEIQEEGYHASGGIGRVAPRPDWGAGKFGKSIALQTMFFNPALTSGLPTAEHDPASSAMGVSRGGAVLHEASHSFADMHDVDLSNAVYARLGATPPAVGAPRKQAYGPRACSALAALHPAQAVTNADSYRLFFEDAYVLFPR